MCYLLTVSIPDQQLPPLQSINRRQIRIAPSSTPSIRPYHPDGWSSFSIATEGCSCNLYHSKDVAYSKQHLDTESFTPSGLRKDIVNALQELVAKYGKIRLSLHFYSGNFETEKFQLSDLGTISFNDFEKGTSPLVPETTFLIEAYERRKSGNHRNK